MNNLQFTVSRGANRVHIDNIQLHKGADPVSAASNADTVQLTLPVNAKAMRIIRLTTAGVMANAGLTIDKTEDLKLAVEEACNCMIQHSGCETLHLSFVTTEEDMLIQIEGSGSVENEGFFDEMEIQVIECILGSMVDGLHIRHEDDKPCLIELTVKLAA